MSDEARLKALMLRGLAGDAKAHAALLSAMSGYLRGYFARRLGAGAADVEDLVQDTLLGIHLKRASYDPALPFTPWAYALARYKLLDHFRRAGVRKTAPLEDAGELFAVENPEEGAVRRDVGKLLSILPKKQRRLVEDVKLTGLSMEEAATRADMSVTAVKVSVHRGMKAMARKVRDEDG
ncbi:MAG TPA: sigma-70 family RNA polymerase sigma factor [Caulobacteraceae bacterium]|nr:sigma-70 family RNA polymerase sigma factor [Caulobacteraceae bacterium]